MSEKYVTRHDPTKEYDLEELEDKCTNGNVIPLIKDLRFVSGLGLKDSKDAIEAIATRDNLGNRRFNVSEVEDLFRQYLAVDPDPYTKEEFLSLIEDAIDSMDSYYYTDMIEATEKLFENVKKRGGLEQLAKERDRFLRKI